MIKINYVKLIDVIIILAVLAMTSIITIFLYQFDLKSSNFVIGHDNNEYIFPLDKNSLYLVDDNGVREIESSIDNVIIIEVIDGEAHFLHSICENSICVKSGFLRDFMPYAACLPEHVYIKLSNESGVDSANY